MIVEQTRRQKSDASGWPFTDTSDAMILRKASSSDFGQSGGSDQSSQSFDGFEDSGFSPFGNRRFYWSSSSAGPFTNPLCGPLGPQGFGNVGGDMDDETQCQQINLLVVDRSRRLYTTGCQNKRISRPLWFDGAARLWKRQQSRNPQPSRNQSSLFNSYRMIRSILPLQHFDIPCTRSRRTSNQFEIMLQREHLHR